MQEAVALLAPALMALGFYSHLHRDKLSNRKLIFAYGIFAVFINLCSFLLILYIFGRETVEFTGRSMVVYLISSTLFALMLPFVVNLIENTVSVEVKKNDQKD